MAILQTNPLRITPRPELWEVLSNHFSASLSRWRHADLDHHGLAIQVKDFDPRRKLTATYIVWRVQAGKEGPVCELRDIHKHIMACRDMKMAASMIIGHVQRLEGQVPVSSRPGGRAKFRADTSGGWKDQLQVFKDQHDHGDEAAQAMAIGATHMLMTLGVLDRPVHDRVVEAIEAWEQPVLTS
jgi:hypothetical protein